MSLLFIRNGSPGGKHHRIVKMRGIFHGAEENSLNSKHHDGKGSFAPSPGRVWPMQNLNSFTRSLDDVEVIMLLAGARSKVLCHEITR